MLEFEYARAERAIPLVRRLCGDVYMGKFMERFVDVYKEKLI